MNPCHLDHTLVRPMIDHLTAFFVSIHVEVLHPDDFDGHRLLKQALPTVKWTTGEHEYSKYGFRKLIEDRSIDILQPDGQSLLSDPCLDTGFLIPPTEINELIHVCYFAALLSRSFAMLSIHVT